MPSIGSVGTVGGVKYMNFFPSSLPNTRLISSCHHNFRHFRTPSRVTSTCFGSLSSARAKSSGPNSRIWMALSILERSLSISSAEYPHISKTLV